MDIVLVLAFYAMKLLSLISIKCFDASTILLSNRPYVATPMDRLNKHFNSLKGKLVITYMSNGRLGRTIIPLLKSYEVHLV